MGSEMCIRDSSHPRSREDARARSHDRARPTSLPLQAQTRANLDRRAAELRESFDRRAAALRARRDGGGGGAVGADGADASRAGAPSFASSLASSFAPPGREPAARARAGAAAAGADDAQAEWGRALSGQFSTRPEQ